ncbi:unnamed protein product [Dibothriocephalus latus]|uniref:Uncharacterized protein n=1 Tax=Dibothriocephalus latus TaxID=60516 RepID=A0A3P7LTW5_DIBLA|nr:unnamed protein product [Dibothriocephalus latus]
MIAYQSPNLLRQPLASTLGPADEATAIRGAFCFEQSFWYCGDRVPLSYDFASASFQVLFRWVPFAKCFSCGLTFSNLLSVCTYFRTRSGIVNYHPRRRGSSLLTLEFALRRRPGRVTPIIVSRVAVRRVPETTDGLSHSGDFRASRDHQFDTSLPAEDILECEHLSKSSAPNRKRKRWRQRLRSFFRGLCCWRNVSTEGD